MNSPLTAAGPHAQPHHAPPLHPLLRHHHPQMAPQSGLSPRPLLISPPKPHSDYLLHLVPQSLPPQSFSFHAPPAVPVSPPGPEGHFTFRAAQQRQFLERTASEAQENKEFRSTTEANFGRNAMSSPQAFSQVRSKGFSEFSPRGRSEIDAREMGGFVQPKAPREVANIEQVRRVSQHRDFSQPGDRKSQRSSSQHNIHITIESSQMGEPAPTITISPNKARLDTAQPITVLPPRVLYPQPLANHQRPTSITQTMVTQQAPVHVSPQPVIVSQPPTIISHHHPVFIQHPAAPVSAPNELKEENTLASYSHQLPNDTLNRDRASSLSIDLARQHRHKKNSVEAVARHEYYNELVEQEEEEEASQTGGRTTGFSAYLTEERLAVNARRLIDEIFENETHRALLQMRVLEATSREKAMRRRSRSKRHS